MAHDHGGVFEISASGSTGNLTVDTTGANAVAPGKRPLSSMTPTILAKGGRPFMVTGSPGGPRIITAVVQAIVNVIVPTRVPPQVAWEFLTMPGQRMTWQPWVTEVSIKGAIGGRRGVGAANHCMHGKDAVVEEILDWRPYDYVTDRTVLETPRGPVKVLHTIELEPDAGGTTIHMRFAAPKSKREKALMEHIGPAYGQALRSGIPSLLSQLDAALAAREADRGPEPELARPRPDGPLAGLAPLVMID